MLFNVADRMEILCAAEDRRLQNRSSFREKRIEKEVKSASNKTRHHWPLGMKSLLSDSFQTWMNRGVNSG